MKKNTMPFKGLSMTCYHISIVFQRSHTSASSSGRRNVFFVEHYKIMNLERFAQCEVSPPDDHALRRSNPLRPGRPEWSGINFERKYLKEERIEKSQPHAFPQIFMGEASNFIFVFQRTPISTLPPA